MSYKQATAIVGEYKDETGKPVSIKLRRMVLEIHGHGISVTSIYEIPFGINYKGKKFIVTLKTDNGIDTLRFIKQGQTRHMLTRQSNREPFTDVHGRVYQPPKWDYEGKMGR